MADEKERSVEDQLHNVDSADTVQSAAMETEGDDPVMALPEIPAPPVEEQSPANPDAMEQPAERRGGSGWKTFAAALALVAVGAGTGSATTWALSRQFVHNALPIGVKWDGTPAAKTIADGLPLQSNVVPVVYQKVSPAVASISVDVKRGFSSGKSSGSGVVVDPKGYILTNNHVVEGGTKITVKFVDGTTLPGTVVGTDRFKDLAVVKVDPGSRTLVAAPLGNSDQVQVGELAIAIGNPFGQEFTVTAGIISGLNRTLKEENNPFAIEGGIQTDAAINPGNSGGPLLNSRGEVIGINTLIDTGNTGLQANVGIGFAVPINVAKEILPTLMAGQTVDYAWLGVSMGTVTPELAKQYGFSVTEGAVVSDVAENSPAGKAGIKSAAFTRRGDFVSADIITAIDGKAIKSADDVVRYIQTKRSGDTISMTVVRGKDTLTMSVTLAPRPQDL